MSHRYFLFLPALLFTSLLYAAPIAVCRSQVNVSLPSNACAVTLTAAMIDGGSYDTSGASFSRSLSGHRNLGPGYHNVVLTITTRIGSNSCTSRVLVEDKTTPVITCHNQTYYLVAPDQDITINVDNLASATDNCETSLDYSISVFDGDSYGSQPFTAMASDNGGNSASCSGTITTVDAEPQNYCSSNRNDYFEHISNLQLSTSTNTVTANTGASGGYDWHYPSGSNILYHGSSYTMSYAPGFRFSTTYHEYWSVYLDKNADGDFTDSGELIHQWHGYGGNSFSFTSPGTVWGWSRIRVVMSYGGYAPSCGGGYGETEDISVYLRPFFYFPWPGFRQAEQVTEQLTAELQSLESPLERPAEPALPGEAAERRQLVAPEAVPATAASTPEIKLFPNPVRAGQSITVTGQESAEELVLRNLTGQVVKTYAGGDSRLDIPANLPAGIYLLGNGGWTRRVVVR